MSPSENDLRAALHEGEGGQLDAGALISHAHAVRRRRQRRTYAAVGAAAAVIVIGGGVAAISGLSSGSTPVAEHSVGSLATPSNEAAPETDTAPGPHSTATSTPASDESSTAVKAPGAANSPGPNPASDHFSTTAGCPSEPSTGTPDGAAALLSDQVASILVCAYPPDPSAQPRSEVLRGAAAAGLVRALRAAPVAPGPTCAGPPAGTLVLHAADASGRDLGSVKFELACDVARPMNSPALHAVRIADLPASVRGILN